MSMTFRFLDENDAAKYKQLRTIALTGPDSRYSTGNPKTELVCTMSEWGARCKETPNHVIVGSFSGESLVGAMTANKVDEMTVRYGEAYVYPNYRGSKAVSVFLAMLDNWALSHGQHLSVFTIREDYTKWLQAHVRRGAIIKSKTIALFADGSSAPICYLERLIPPSALERLKIA
ncbi:MAG: hypothetical protein PHW63_00460 [Alphaproteobacteria bacterium]|nr:hypothetical protein [Alphaproteobacteria bacterium]